ncbi:hypothetical protein ACFU7Y_32305 [Kitasatospora sp. NPDC057542]|uniref:hypothetical protein n=1 Tax=Streptomycetaceae TaxID=2062 RepID=UPI001CC9F243|nr:hypothetical protein [Streptomyces sp. LS1784]
METLLHAVGLVEEDGTHTLVVQDVVRGTVRTTPDPEAVVDELPTFLSALSAKLDPAPSRGRW